MKLRLIVGPSGAPNFCYGTEDGDTGKEVDFVQSDHGYPDLAQKLGAVLPDQDEVGYSAYLLAASEWLDEHDGEMFDVPDDAEVIDN